MQQLPLFLNLQGRTVIVIGEGEAAEAKARLARRAGAQIVPAWQAGAAIAFVALEDDAEAARIAADLRARGLLVNVVDRPALCDFTTPAIIDRAPVTIAVGTAGASAGLAKAVRQRIEAMLPPRLGALASALFAARPAIAARWPAAPDRRRALDAALASGGPLDPLRVEAGDADDMGAAKALATWLETARDPAASRVETIRLTSPDPDDLTLRDARLLGEADHIFHLPDVPADILNRGRADSVRHLGETPPFSWPGGLSLWVEFAR